MLAFVGLPPFRRPQRPEIQETQTDLGNGFRERSGFHKIDKFWAFVGSPLHFGCPQMPEIQEILKSPWKWLLQKRADSTKSTTFGLLWVPLPEIDNFWAFGHPRSQRPLANPNRPKEMASGKGADSTRSTSFGLLWGPLHFGGP